MKEVFKRYLFNSYAWSGLILTGLLLIGCLLRSVDLKAFQPNVRDEASWFLIGTSLIETRVPTSWSIFPHSSGKYYKNCQEVVTPFLGHPPLFGLLIGGWAHLVGKVDWCNLDLTLLRLPMLPIALLSMLFTFLLVDQLFGRRLAWFTLLAFVFFPSHVITARLIAAEHLIGLLLILGLYLFAILEQARGKHSRWAMVGIAFLCLVSPLTKLSGIVVPASLVLLALYKKRRKLAVLLTATALASLALFMAYGWYFNWDDFISISQAHAVRAQSFAHWWTIFTHLDVATYSFFDVSIIVGMVGLFALVLKKGVRGSGIYVLAPLLAFSFIFLQISPWESYGWYKYAIYPLMSIGLGYVFDELYSGHKAFLFLFVLTMGVMLEKSGLFQEQLGQRIAMAVIYLLVVLMVVLRVRWLPFKSVFITLLVLLFFFEVLWSLDTLGVFCLPGSCV